MACKQLSRASLRCAVFGIVMLMVGSTPGSAQVPSFTPLYLPYTGYFSPTGVSANGQVVSGWAYTLNPVGDYARRWRAGIGFDYPGPATGPTTTSATGVSADGLTMSGNSGHAQFGDLEGWVRYGNSVGHVGSPSGHDTSECWAISGDGVTTVGDGGFQSNPNLYQAARYTAANDWSNLGFLPGGNWSRAFGVNHNGSVIVGASSSNAISYGTSAFRWTAATGMVSLGNLPGGQEGVARGVSADGAVIVGSDYLGSQQHAWRWDAVAGIQDLGVLYGASVTSALAVSSDGLVIVGYSDQVAFIWDAAHGMRDLKQVLIAQGLGAQVAAFNLSEASAIAGAGPDHWIVGSGDDGSLYVGWRAHVGDVFEPASSTQIGMGCGFAGMSLSSNPPHLGQGVTFTVGGVPAGATVDLFFSAVPGSPLSIGSGCDLYVDLMTLSDAMVLPVGVGGVAQLSAVVPSWTTLLGVQLAGQAIAIPSPGPLGFSLSNGLDIVIGP